MIKRELYLDKIRRLINTEPIKIITGVRRSGKTYLLHSIKEELIEQGISKENIFLISFESQKYNKIQNFMELDVCVNNLIKNTSGKIYLLFDEIQNIVGWEKSINSYRVDFDCDIYITGSNSELLSGELATLIAGRYFHIDVYPFSFKEFLQYKKEINSIDVKNKELQLFNEYVKYGGMPSLQQVQDIDKFSYLEDIYSTILLKDIISRHNLRNAEILNRILTFIISNIGQPVSANGISKYLKHENLKVSADTVLNYLSFSKNACFIHEAKKENLKGKKVLKTNGKYYLVDHGFNQAIIGKDMENTGQILENIVYIELLRRGYDVKVGDINGREVDFVCNKADRKIYIQVAYLLSGKETVKREFGSLRAIGDDYEKYVLSMDNLDFSNAGIKHMNIIEFLKNDII